MTHVQENLVVLEDFFGQLPTSDTLTILDKGNTKFSYVLIMLVSRPLEETDESERAISGDAAEIYEPISGAP